MEQPIITGRPKDDISVTWAIASGPIQWSLFGGFYEPESEDDFSERESEIAERER